MIQVNSKFSFLNLNSNQEFDPSQIISTQSNTPENSLILDNNEDGIIIDVKPKRKNFSTCEERKKFIEEYKKKFKTEMCKNWIFKGKCKFGNNCSFAHGIHEIKEKNHLHQNYKTKPCQQFFMKGFCFYGNRCQYLHSEIKYFKEFNNYLIKVYESKNFMTKKFQNFLPESILLEEMEKTYIKCNNLNEFFNLISTLSKKRPNYTNSFNNQKL